MSRPAQGLVPEVRTLFLIEPAGTDVDLLHASIQRALDPSEVMFVGEDGPADGRARLEDVRGLDRRAKHRLRIVAGAFAFGLHASWKSPVTYAALSRDPLSRILARFGAFLEAFPDAPDRDGSAPMTFEHYVFGLHRLVADNALTRLLAGRPRVAFGACDEALFGLAMRNIEDRSSALLVADTPSAVLGPLASLLGRPLRPDDAGDASDPTTAARPAPEVPRDILDRVEELNRFDRRLHAHAVGHLVAGAATTP